MNKRIVFVMAIGFSFAPAVFAADDACKKSIMGVATGQCNQVTKVDAWAHCPAEEIKVLPGDAAAPAHESFGTSGSGELARAPKRP
jgi:hypothetical protein